MARSFKELVLTRFAPSVVLVLVFLSATRLNASDGRTRITDDRTINAPIAGSHLREIAWTPAVPVEGAVNTSVDEYEPRVSADGSTLVFVRRRPGGNADLFAAQWTPTGWSEAAPIESINTEGDELGPDLSRDGCRLYFYSDREGGLGGFDLWVSARTSTSEPWTAPQPLGDTINSPWNEYGPSCTPDGSVLYFASNRPREPEAMSAATDRWTATLRERRSRHDYDVYVSTRIEGGWTSSAIVDQIATGDDEGSPAVSPAGDFLYFASDRPGGAGGYDIYRLRLTHEGVTDRQALIESLGAAINSSANELDPGLAAEGFRLYFSTDRGADAARADYSLFTSTSREVRRIDAVESASASLWSQLWPWLLLLLLLALLGLLLALLVARHDAWRRRLGQLSLLAQCLLLSLLLHLVIAALLAAWKVGGMVAEQLGGDAHRVHLSSAPDGAADSLAAQIRGALTTVEDAGSVAQITPLEPDVDHHTAAVVTPVPIDPMLAASAPPLVSGAEEDASDTIRAATPPERRPEPLTAQLPTPPARIADAAPEAPSVISSSTPLSAPLAAALSSEPDAPVALEAMTLPVPALAPASPDEAPEFAAVPTSTINPRQQGSTAEAVQAAALPASPPPEAAVQSEANDATFDQVLPQAAQLNPTQPALPAASTDDQRQRSEASGSLVSSALRSTSIPSLTASSPTSDTEELPSSSSALPSSATRDTVGAIVGSAAVPSVPEPLEDFAQRDPALREAMLEQTGGSVATEESVMLALAWLAQRQESQGYWDARANEGTVDADAAMTGLALLCYLGAGHTHQSEGPYQDTVRRALRWLTERQRPDGDLRHDEDGRRPADTMYGQTIATVALCEAFAMTRDPSLAQPARRAASFVLERAEDAQRGRAAANDTAVLGWLIMTVESARRAGFDPPQALFGTARQWLDQTSVSRLRGRYAYQPNGPASPAMTAEAMFVQQLLGRAGTEPRMQESAAYIADTLPAWTLDAPTHHWYYATLALFQQQGEHWERWNSALTRELLAHQRKGEPAIAGSWDPQDRWSRAGGRVYQTAICTLSLEVYYRYRAPNRAPVSDRTR